MPMIPPPVAPYIAPYVDMTLKATWTPSGMQPVYLPDITRAAGITAVNAAFIVAQGSSQCQASWGGSYPVSSGFAVQSIKDLINGGGHVRISFGGASGVPLESACSDVSSLTNAINTVISTYGSKDLDFDIEGSNIANQAGNLRLAQALSQLQMSDANITVSLTLPVLPTGLTPDGLNVVNIFQQNKVNFKVNLMAMDYGASGIDMSQAAIQALQSTYQQLLSIFPGKAIADLLVVTPMIGVNDVQGEIFSLDNAATLTTYAQQNNIAIRYWSLTRDQSCSQIWASPTCSGAFPNGTPVQSMAYQFAGKFNVGKNQK